MTDESSLETTSLLLLFDFFMDFPHRTPNQVEPYG